MKHFANSAFWSSYRKLPERIQTLADKSFDLLKRDPSHPSLYFKRIRKKWSARIGLRHRALGVEVDEGIVWYWIGTHAQYDRKIK